MSFKVIDAAGNVVEIPDGAPIPSGCRLAVPLSFMDSAQRRALAAVRQHYGAAPLADDAEGDDQDDGDGDSDGDDDQRDEADDGGEELTDELEAEQRRQDAYYEFRQRIDTANVNRKNRRRSSAPALPAPKPKEQPWLKMPGQGDASLADAQTRRADAYRKFCDKIHTASPRRRGPSSPSAPAAAWVSGADADAASAQRERLELLKRAYSKPPTA